MLMLNGKEVCRVVYIPKHQKQAIEDHVDKLEILKASGKLFGYTVNPMAYCTHVCIVAQV